MDTLESMRAFVRVVELGSFAGAARSLHMSPAMVTKHVVNLEERTGARLLHRTTRQVRLTDTGQVYFERCVTLLGEVEAAEAEAGADVSEPRGVLKITVPVEFGNPYLSPIISEFIELYPKIDLDLHFTNRVVNIMEVWLRHCDPHCRKLRHNAPWPPAGGVELPHRGQPGLHRETRPA